MATAKTRTTRTKVGKAVPAVAPVAAVPAPVPPTAPPPPRRPKQAVVVVHGIGEQRPLETLREFVEAVYQRDLTLTDDDPRDRGEDENGKPINRVWAVPDDSTGSKELRRITTTGGKDGKRTDFYEFYWADIAHGTPLEMVTAWFRGILIRSPFRVPRRTQMWIAWLLLWVLSIAFVLMGYLIADPDVQPVAGWVAAWVSWLRAVRVPLAILLGALGLAALIFRAVKTRPISRIKLTLPVILILLSGALFWFASYSFAEAPRFWAGLITAAIGAAIAGLVVPYVGDIVSFVRATPGTIATRAAVRERGLKLMHDLHNKGLDPVTKAGTREYDRIILVGHSLGAIVAYDLLQRFWEEAGPNPRDGVMPQPLVDALNAVDKFVEALALNKPGFNLANYRQAQVDLHRELVAAGQGWLVSDFVTLGSPIVHSEFLVADSREHLDTLLKERMFSASPPRPDLPNNSMLYDAPGTQQFPHHAAAFAPVRWTNFSDEHWFPLLGDVVSGRVPDVFGPGIAERPVTISRGWIPVLSRFVTHTLYWSNTSGDWAAPADHLVQLRQALKLK